MPTTAPTENTPEATPGPTITDTSRIPPPPVPEILVLFEDDFGSGLKPEWQGNRNSWRVLNQQATSISCGVISVGSLEWNNYVLSFTFELPTATDGNVQVLFAAHDPQNSWVAALLTEGENGAVSLLKRTDSGVTWPPGVTTQRNGLFGAQQSSQFTLQVEGSMVRLSINDQEAYNVDLADDLSGAIGLRACPKSLSWIDDLKVVSQHALERLERFGPTLRRPHVDYLHDDIYELRVQTPGGRLRFFYFFFAGNKIIVTHAIKKKTGPVPPAEINRAIAQRAAYFERNEGE